MEDQRVEVVLKATSTKKRKHTVYIHVKCLDQRDEGFQNQDHAASRILSGICHTTVIA